MRMRKLSRVTNPQRSNVSNGAQVMSAEELGKAGEVAGG